MAFIFKVLTFEIILYSVDWHILGNIMHPEPEDIKIMCTKEALEHTEAQVASALTISTYFMSVA